MGWSRSVPQFTFTSQFTFHDGKRRVSENSRHKKMHRNDFTFIRFWALIRRHEHVPTVRHEYPQFVVIVRKHKIVSLRWNSPPETRWVINLGRNELAKFFGLLSNIICDGLVFTNTHIFLLTLYDNNSITAFDFPLIHNVAVIMS